ncbi:MAG: hypothetical protein BHW44_00450 [Roseburia sp. 40_7]|uniref:DUF4190 domain-containing protein n=1 Tax=uncultured Eubacterium sp. TaxID=165185 RepID=UPI00096244C5|nr:DUF4190 domain-containing protein [uncultured Eubacterium sp.]MCI6537578.1 DUF4190 domain-containing protein [Lachnospiraceae bacterium]OLA92978.1 MAG: hypothetical protein BHW44_00450 [Roseburia sp. 40_7]
MEKNNNSLAVVALVLGIVSIITWLFPIAGYITTIIAIVLGVKGRKSEKRGMATAGMVLGIIFLIITLLNSIIGVLLAFLAIQN